MKRLRGPQIIAKSSINEVGMYQKYLNPISHQTMKTLSKIILKAAREKSINTELLSDNSKFKTKTLQIPRIS